MPGVGGALGIVAGGELWLPGRDWDQVSEKSGGLAGLVWVAQAEDVQPRTSTNGSAIAVATLSRRMVAPGYSRTEYQLV